MTARVACPTGTGSSSPSATPAPWFHRKRLWRALGHGGQWASQPGTLHASARPSSRLWLGPRQNCPRPLLSFPGREGGLPGPACLLFGHRAVTCDLCGLVELGARSAFRAMPTWPRGAAPSPSCAWGPVPCLWEARGPRFLQSVLGLDVRWGVRLQRTRLRPLWVHLGPPWALLGVGTGLWNRGRGGKAAETQGRWGHVLRLLS